MEIWPGSMDMDAFLKSLHWKRLSELWLESHLECLNPQGSAWVWIGTPMRERQQVTVQVCGSLTPVGNLDWVPVSWFVPGLDYTAESKASTSVFSFCLSRKSKQFNKNRLKTRNASFTHRHANEGFLYQNKLNFNSTFHKLILIS